jgi:hypothetical protein
MVEDRRNMSTNLFTAHCGGMIASIILDLHVRNGDPPRKSLLREIRLEPIKAMQPVTLSNRKAFLDEICTQC